MNEWFIVTCRVAFDDEDTLFVVEAFDEAEARAAAIALLVEDLNPEEHATDEDGAIQTYVNYVVRCGEEQPEIVATPLGSVR
jgi:hypothetical protein